MLFPCSASLEARTDPSLNFFQFKAEAFPNFGAGKIERNPTPKEAGKGMIYYVYILKSRKNGKRYTGFTRKVPAVRLVEHNKGINRWTSKNRPFDLIYFEKFRSRKDGLNREKYFKTAAGRRWLDEKFVLSNVIPLFRLR